MSVIYKFPGREAAFARAIEDRKEKEARVRRDTLKRDFGYSGSSPQIYEELERIVDLEYSLRDVTDSDEDEHFTYLRKVSDFFNSIRISIEGYDENSYRIKEVRDLSQISKMFILI